MNPERTGARKGDLVYEDWHRTLPNYCYWMNVDALEMRKGRGAVAAFELICCRGRLGEEYWKAVLKEADWKIRIVRWTAKKLKCPGFLVVYEYDLAKFWLLDLLRHDARRFELDKDGYADFIKKL